MIQPFELDWLGGTAEAFFRRKRSVDDLPWGTLDPGAFPPRLLAHACDSWTEGAWNEYTTAVAFSAILRAFLEAAVPVDLIGMAGEFVADEMLHVELNCRVAMELGGASPLAVDFEQLLPPTTPNLTPRQRASELVVRTCCVGEAFSVPILSGSFAVARHPLTRAVLRRIVQDEGPHASLGWLYLEWAQEWLTDAERDRLGQVAADAVSSYLPAWDALTSWVDADGRTSEGYHPRPPRERSDGR